MVQQDVSENDHKNRDDHAHIDVKIMGDLRIVDDGDLLCYEIEVIVLGEGLRLGGDDGCDATRQEHRCERCDERLHIEFLDQCTGQQTECYTDKDHDDHCDRSGDTGIGHLDANDRSNGHYSTDGQINTAREHRQRHRNRQNDQVGMIDEQRGDESPTQVGAEQRLPHDDHQDENHHGRDSRNHLGVDAAPTGFQGLLLTLSSCCRSHAATALVCALSACLRFISALRL